MEFVAHGFLFSARLGCVELHCWTLRPLAHIYSASVNSLCTNLSWTRLTGASLVQVPYYARVPAINSGVDLQWGVSLADGGLC